MGSGRLTMALPAADLAARLDGALVALREVARAGGASASPTGEVWRTVSDELVRLGPPVAVVPRAVPVCTALPTHADDPLTAALLPLLPHLRWDRNASYDDPHFLERYGYCELVGAGPWSSSAVRVGVLLLAAQTQYPAHAHPAEEIYLVLQGSARWSVAGAAAREVGPGAVVHHPAHAAHAMRALAAPLLALYCWRGAIASPARLVPDAAVSARNQHESMD